MGMSRRDVMSAGAAFGAASLWGGSAFAADEAFYPIKLLYNVPFTGVVIDKHDPLPFLVDTSSSFVLIDGAAAEQLGLTKAKDVSFGSSTFKITRYETKEILIGGALKLEDQKIAAFPGRVTDIVKGRVPATIGAPIKIDFEAGRVRFIKSVPEETKGLESIGYTSRESGATKDMVSSIPIIEVELDGNPVRLRVDTTSTAGLTLSSKYVQKKGLWTVYGAGYEHKGYAGTSFGSYKAVKAGKLKIDKYGFAAPVIHLSDPNATEIASSSATPTDPSAPPSSAPGGRPAMALPTVPSDGTIGVELLRRFHIISDPRTGRVFLSPNKMIADGYRTDRGGLDIQDVEGALQVTDVAAGSAAEKAGLKVGDKVTGWKGDGGYGGMMWALKGAPGDKVSIQVARESGPAFADVILADRL